jgi:hypothetical protein
LYWSPAKSKSAQENNIDIGSNRVKTTSVYAKSRLYLPPDILW